MYNLLSQSLIQAKPLGPLTLAGVLAALARDAVESFPALRPHQAMFWHMFLVQLAALALHRAGRDRPPEDEAAWAALLRGLTPAFAEDEPWCLVVDDWSKPAFLQPPVPDDVEFDNEAPTPDAIDLLITAKNHDLKQAIARAGTPEDWIFALVSLQTGEGYGGRNPKKGTFYFGIARMNGGSSSRAMLTLAPLPGADEKVMAPRPGAWFSRDVRTLLAKREEMLDQTKLDYPDTGLGLTWLAPWPEGEQLQTGDLDIWFIEVCRRVRLLSRSGRFVGLKGTSKATRINAKHLKGVVGDPWAPIHRQESKSLTIGDDGDFHYRILVELLFSGEWIMPLLARRAPFETAETPVAIVAQALARGTSKTGGFRSRLVPVSSPAARSGWNRGAREKLNLLARDQIDTIKRFDRALAYALALAAADGVHDNVKREFYVYTKPARAHLERHADSIFFAHLWRQFEAAEQDEAVRQAAEADFVRDLWQRTRDIFEEFLPTMPCPSLYRHRAEARARAALWGNRDLRRNHPEIFEHKEKGGEDVA
ncbi:hypothetical protein [Chelativorans intermedius]|uniref:CRISPR-associated protein, Cse1 family n=1 Tax=Chelativorans intermedius TaxID=515947 RepID=A0ABV6DD47_9HYPH|nr:hypothetical protein [Chelativorans intermedius]MCT8999210.1 hypothetical protein [Chelativorans intermedius]